MKLAGCIIKDEAGKLLLLHRNTAKRQQWEVPGGKVEDGEDLETTAVREAQEELGVQVKIVSLIGAREFQEGDYTFDYSWFLASITSGTPRVTEPETFDNLKYVSLDEVRTLNISAGASAFLIMLKEENITL